MDIPPPGAPAAAAGSAPPSSMLPTARRRSGRARSPRTRIGTRTRVGALALLAGLAWTPSAASAQAPHLGAGVGLGSAAAVRPASMSAPAACTVDAETRQRWATGFAAAAGEYAGTLGLALALPGGEVLTWGPLQRGPAWSTAKVPLAIAVSRADGGSPTAADAASLDAALTRSDNAAAQALWLRLGDDSAAAAAVTAVLADAGDTATVVPDHALREGYSVFGQTDWALADQARFATRLPDLAGAEAALAAMGAVTPEQRWGLGRLDAVAAFKGGWGPDPDATYLVRQFGLLRLPSGAAAGVGLAARSDGFDAGIAGDDLLADLVGAMVADVAGSC